MIFGEMDGGCLICKGCGEQYQIIDGIPVLYPNAGYSPDIHKRHWDREANAKSYAKKYDNYLKKQGTPWGLYTHISEMRAMDKLVKAVKLDLNDKTIIDCGCGNGRLLSYYKEAGLKIGLDASLILLKEAKMREPGFLFVCGQLEDLPFKDCIADYSVSIRVFQHLLTPEIAFSEMARVTKPSGFVALELYNKFNLKELYKRFRMLKFMDRIDSWGLAYDRYYSYREIEQWARRNFVKPIKYSGAGWGAHFYLFELIKFRKYAPNWLQKIVFDFYLSLENIVGMMPFFSKTLEKVCFIGTLQPVQAVRESHGVRIIKYLKRKKDLKNAKNFEKILNERNYCLADGDDAHLRLTIGWLKNAQDATPDGGVSRGRSLIKSGKSNDEGWQPSYPETTGYIIPTFIKASKYFNNPDLLRRAKLMADWEINILHKDGSVHGGNICEKPNSAIFDTGQVARGLTSIYRETNEEKYLSAAIKACAWMLQKENNKEGYWMMDKSNCVSECDTTYNVYAIAPMVELGKLIGNKDFIDAGRRAGEYTLKMQNENGWFKKADFKDSDRPLLHTIGYTIDGLWDLGDLLDEKKFMDGAQKAIDGILSKIKDNGFIAGRLNSDWDGVVDWACLTGLAQIGVTCFKIYKYNKEEKYCQAALKIKEYIKSCQNNMDEKNGGLGAVWGSWPISGQYGQYQALNWAAKYFADLLLMNKKNECFMFKFLDAADCPSASDTDRENNS